MDASSSGHPLLRRHLLRPRVSAASRDAERQAARDHRGRGEAEVGEIRHERHNVNNANVSGISSEPPGGGIENDTETQQIFYHSIFTQNYYKTLF